MQPALSSRLRARLVSYPEPPDIGVRIWTASLDSLMKEEVAQLTDILEKDENARAARFHFERDRDHYIGARGFLRHLVSTALETSPASVRFTYGPRGKPALLQARDSRTLCFNVSHSAGQAMFALSWNREVGLDLESIARVARDDAHLADLAARVLSERELACWHLLPDSTARHAAFLRAWTRKEALAKATGEGLAAGLREIEVILDAQTPVPSLVISSSRQGVGKDWTLHDLRAPEGFVAAIAIARA